MIRRNIGKSKAPVVVFVGPPDCGKSMVLQSLVDYLNSSKENQFSFDPEEKFLVSINDNNNNNEESKRSDDKELEEYAKVCNQFKDMIVANAKTKQDNVKKGLRGSKNQILVNVKEKNNLILRLLEAPGKDFFAPKDTDAPFNSEWERFFSKHRDRYPVYFVILLDLHTGEWNFKYNDVLRGKYEDRLLEIIDKCYKKKDRLILLYNKWDLRGTDDSLDNILDSYPNLRKVWKKKVGVIFERNLYEGPIAYISGKNFEGKEESLKYYTDKETVKCSEQLWKYLNPYKSLF